MPREKVVPHDIEKKIKSCLKYKVSVEDLKKLPEVMHGWLLNFDSRFSENNFLASYTNSRIGVLKLSEHLASYFLSSSSHWYFRDRIPKLEMFSLEEYSYDTISVQRYGSLQSAQSHKTNKRRNLHSEKKPANFYVAPQHSTASGVVHFHDSRIPLPDYLGIEISEYMEKEHEETMKRVREAIQDELTDCNEGLNLFTIMKYSWDNSREHRSITTGKIFFFASSSSEECFFEIKDILNRIQYLTYSWSICLEYVQRRKRYISKILKQSFKSELIQINRRIKSYQTMMKIFEDADIIEHVQKLGGGIEIPEERTLLLLEIEQKNKVIMQDFAKEALQAWNSENDLFLKSVSVLTSSLKELEDKLKDVLKDIRDNPWNRPDYESSEGEDDEDILFKGPIDSLDPASMPDEHAKNVQNHPVDHYGAYCINLHPIVSCQGI